MAAVGAARWDATWDRGADWQARIGRRTRNDAVLRLGEPAAWEVRPVDTPSTRPPLFSAAVTVIDEGRYLDVAVSREQIESVVGKHAEYRLLALDLAAGRPIVVLRGYVKIRDGVGDD